MTGSPLLDDQIAEYRELKACELFLPWTGELLLSPASSGSVERPIGAMWGKGGSVCRGITRRDRTWAIW